MSHEYRRREAERARRIMNPRRYGSPDELPETEHAPPARTAQPAPQKVAPSPPRARSRRRHNRSSRRRRSRRPAPPRGWSLIARRCPPAAKQQPSRPAQRADDPGRLPTRLSARRDVPGPGARRNDIVVETSLRKGGRRHLLFVLLLRLDLGHDDGVRRRRRRRRSRGHGPLEHAAVVGAGRRDGRGVHDGRAGPAVAPCCRC